MSLDVRLHRLAVFFAASVLVGSSFELVPVVVAAERSAAPAAMDFNGPREAWRRLAQDLRRGDKAAAMKLFTPLAQERYEKTIDEWLKMKPFDEARFGVPGAVTLSGGQFATLTVKRKKDDGTYAGQVMLMRGDDGKWRIDRM